MKKIALDSYYYENFCYTVGVIFDNWEDKTPEKIISTKIKNFSEYIPGQFYKRELPGIIKTLELINLSEFDTIIVDGFVNMLDKDKILIHGLGYKLKEYLNNDKIDIVGVAKSKFGYSDLICIPVIRGESINPLWISSTGPTDTEIISNEVKSMDGNYRIPTLLKMLDQETKKYKKK